jgi:hypothetical protein
MTVSLFGIHIGAEEERSVKQSRTTRFLRSSAREGEAWALFTRPTTPSSTVSSIRDLAINSIEHHPINNTEEVVMKKLNCVVWFAICLAPFFSSCQTRVDLEKEKEAIKAVLEQEKKGYFDKNSEMMAATWVQKSSSVKMFMSQEGEIDMFGWEKISERDKEDISKDYSDYKNIHVGYSDFQFSLYESNAWAIFKARWDWTYKDKPGKLEQTRIMAFEKVEGKWKTTLMAIYNVPTEKEEAQKKTEEGSK